MDKTDLLFLLDYSAWANQKLSKAGAQLNPEQFAAPHRTSYGSLRGIMVHLLVAHQVWLSRCQEGRLPATFPAQAEFPDFASLESSLRAEVLTWRRYLETMPEAGVQRGVVYTTSQGATFTHSLWQIVVHLVNHTTQHRSEAAEVLTEYGCSPGDLDVIWYMRQAA